MRSEERKVGLGTGKSWSEVETEKGVSGGGGT